MADRIAIKRLSASDCTLFKGAFQKADVGNQKSINLNKDVLVDSLYPELPSIAANSDNEIALAISLYGPNAKPAHKVARKIIKNATYKNWRLNGEFIPGPEGDSGRYDAIRPGDFAVMAFKGASSPTGMDLIIVKQDAERDIALHAELGKLFGNRSMITTAPSQVALAAKSAGVAEDHPIFLAAADSILDAAIEDAAQGGIDGTSAILSSKSGRKISAIDLAKAKAKADQVGQDGEGLVNGFLTALKFQGSIKDLDWASSKNAISPFDFLVSAEDQGEESVEYKVQRIDVKSTGGVFSNPIHISLAEIICASEYPYLIYRVSELDEAGGMLHISESISDFAKNLKGITQAQMPVGVKVDSFSVAPSVFIWGAPQYVAWPDEEEDLD